MVRTGILVGVLAAAAGLALAPVPVAAQTDPVRVVDISFDTGAYDPSRQDWPIVGVEVRGDLDAELFGVDLLGQDGAVLWSGAETFAAPSTRIAVVPFVAVGDLTAVRVLQREAVVAEVVVEPLSDAPPSASAPELPPPVAGVEEEAPPPPPRDGIRAEIFRQGGGGGGGSGPLALSLILAIIVVAIAFRSPLPSASTQRWTK